LGGDRTPETPPERPAATADRAPRAAGAAERIDFCWCAYPETRQPPVQNIATPKRPWRNRCKVRWLSPGVAWVALALALPSIVFA